jgi:hypothetical protein
LGDQITADIIKVGKLYAQEKNVQLRIFHTPRVLTINSLIFDHDEMERWWQEDWEYAQQEIISNNQA